MWHLDMVSRQDVVMSWRKWVRRGSRIFPAVFEFHKLQFCSKQPHFGGSAAWTPPHLHPVQTLPVGEQRRELQTPPPVSEEFWQLPAHPGHGDSAPEVGLAYAVGTVRSKARAIAPMPPPMQVDDKNRQTSLKLIAIPLICYE